MNISKIPKIAAAGSKKSASSAFQTKKSASTASSAFQTKNPHHLRHPRSKQKIRITCVIRVSNKKSASSASSAFQTKNPRHLRHPRSKQKNPRQLRHPRSKQKIRVICVIRVPNKKSAFRPAFQPAF
ncbi:MAG: hypothetical protein JNN28_10175 [Saprospiraceae bacterium]|nr:hypothetical protein [Saprospiraceae bacterium]